MKIATHVAAKWNTKRHRVVIKFNYFSALWLYLHIIIKYWKLKFSPGDSLSGKTRWWSTSTSTTNPTAYLHVFVTLVIIVISKTERERKNWLWLETQFFLLHVNWGRVNQTGHINHISLCLWSLVPSKPALIELDAHQKKQGTRQQNTFIMSDKNKLYIFTCLV